jgi:hypothetical protein
MSVDIDAEDWTDCEKHPQSNVECVNHHQYRSYAKFSGYKVGFVAKTPCPTCGVFDLHRISSGYRTLSGGLSGELDG